jgi:hypothetical protein
MRNDEVKTICRRALCLHLLPPEKIPKVFAILKKAAIKMNHLGDKHKALKSFFAYMENTWIKGSVWPPSKWSVFMQPIRTNNDAEGWHNRINKRFGKVGINLYELIPLLLNEAKLIPLQCILLRQETLTRRLTKISQCFQAKLFTIWGKFGKCFNTFALLVKCSDLYLTENQLSFDYDVDDSRGDSSEETDDE